MQLYETIKKRFTIPRDGRGPLETHETPTIIDIGKPTFDEPFTQIAFRYPSVPNDTLEGDVQELLRRWQEYKPQRHFSVSGNRIIQFDPEILGATAAVVRPGMIYLITLQNPVEVLKPLLPAILLETAGEPESYKTEVWGVRPRKQEETIFHVRDTLIQPVKQFIEAINVDGFKAIAAGSRQYMPEGENFYTLDFDPYDSDPSELKMRLKSRRTQPVTLERVGQTLTEDWEFFHNEAKQTLSEKYPALAP